MTRARLSISARMQHLHPSATRASTNAMLPIIACIAMLALLGLGLSSASAHAFGTDEETMLMFVGEVEPAITVASRQPESPSTAPAMATVIGRAQIERYGYRTLADLLADQPGFYMLGGGRGTVPYFRGVRNGILFMYDGVPITTDVTKNFAPLDMEYSLGPIEQVEITTGPGSVLWGTDAFAAVVNIVPSSARSRAGVHISAAGGTQHRAGADLSLGHATPDLDVYLYATSARARFHNDEYRSLDERSSTIDASKATELVANINYRDWFHLSGRWSETERNFTMRDAVNDLLWDGSRQTPFNYVKMSLTGNHGPAHYSLTGYLQQSDFKQRDADIERKQENTSSYLEFLWDRRFLGRGLITAGASWRASDVKGAVIRDSFQPDFPKPEEQLFVPTLDQKDFSSDLYAAFTQVRYRWGKSEMWLGARYEDHSEYAESISYSTGFQTALHDTLRLKASYGTAYRSPYSRQLFNSDSLNQEQISTLSTQLAWKPASGHHYALTLFHSRIKHHRNEDPYGGLSREAAWESYGAELALQTPITRSLSTVATFSWVEDNRGDELYQVRAYSIVRPDGSREDVYESWSQPANTSPEWMARLSIDWNVAQGHNFVLTAASAGKVHASYSKNAVTTSYSSPITLNAAYTINGLFEHWGDRITLRLNNILDRNYQQPDVYGPVKGEPFSATLIWSIAF
ncbi:MAG: TonB-dependent receptor plug domain-containing protein [Desulfuromonadaceae bacterium]|nr:TonB-dependent receptor plug domain-containing protein [Desulfuromonadaceae bacterium]